MSIQKFVDLKMLSIMYIKGTKWTEAEIEKFKLIWSTEPDIHKIHIEFLLLLVSSVLLGGEHTYREATRL